MALWTTISAFLGLLATVNGQVGGMGMGGMGMGGMGTCTFDPKCYYAKPGCSLVKEFPYWRMTPTTCEDCLSLCQQKIAGPNPPYCCRSAVWDAQTQTCDLFAVVSRGSANMNTYPGRIYFQPTGAPGCASNNTPAANGTAPAGNACKDGETAKVIAYKDYAVDSLSGGKEASGVSDADGCAKACLSGGCKAAQFKDGKCTISDTAPKEGDTKKADGATFYRFFCFPSDLVKGCPDTFIAAPQKILVGQNKQTLDKETFDECIKSCLNSQKENGFVCKSAIFYYNEKKLNCILNIESAKTKPDLYTDAGPDDIEIYFEPGCGGGQKFKDAAKKRTKAFKDALYDITDQWSNWSPCHGRGSQQVRFQQCGEKDSRNCPKDYRSCNPSVPADKAVSHNPGKLGADEKLISEQRKRARARARDQAVH